MGNEKVVIGVIDKVGYHGKTFTFYNNKGTEQGMIGKALTFGFGVFWDGG